MFLNEAKGSFGMFSRAGRHSTEKFHILMKKEEIISDKKKTKSTDIYGDPKNKEYSDDEEEIEMNKIQKLQNRANIVSAAVKPTKKVKLFII